MKEDFGVVFERGALLTMKAIIFIKQIVIIFPTNVGFFSTRDF